MSGKTRALIFDFDGLIVDTESPHFESWRRAYAAFGCGLPLSVWVSNIGRGDFSKPFDPYRYLEQLAGRPINHDDVRAIRRRHAAALLDAEGLRPGVQAYLETAAQVGIRLGIASSSPREWIDRHLSRLGVAGRFDCIKCGDHVRRGKPDPEVYRLVLAALDVHPCEAIAFEDSPVGVFAAKAAGIYCVAVPNPITRHLPLGAADLLLDSLADRPLKVLLEMARPPGGNTP